MGGGRGGRPPPLQCGTQACGPRPCPPRSQSLPPPPGSARGPWLTPRTRGRALRAPPLSSCSRGSPAPTWPRRPLIRSRDQAGQRGGVGIRFTPGGSERRVRPRATAHGGSLEAGPSTALRLPGAGRGHWPGHPRPPRPDLLLVPRLCRGVWHRGRLRQSGRGGLLCLLLPVGEGLASKLCGMRLSTASPPEITGRLV